MDFQGAAPDLCRRVQDTDFFGVDAYPDVDVGERDRRSAKGEFPVSREGQPTRSSVRCGQVPVKRSEPR